LRGCGLPLKQFGNWYAKLIHEEPASADKRRIVAETCREGASVSGVARKYGVGTRLLFSWKKELTPATPPGPTFLPVTLTDAPEQSAPVFPPAAGPAPVIVE
jgi:hypothetical protein